MRGSLNTSDLIEPPDGQMSMHSSTNWKSGPVLFNYIVKYSLNKVEVEVCPIFSVFLTAVQGDKISRTVIDYYPVAFYEFWEPAYSHNSRRSPFNSNRFQSLKQSKKQLGTSLALKYGAFLASSDIRY